MLRNSEALAVFDAILHFPPARNRAVELAGRGIAAAVRCTMTVLDGKTEVFDDPPEAATRRVLAAADRLMVLGDLEDDLAGAWRRRQRDEIGDEVFEQALREIVARLEAWPGDYGPARAGG